MAYTPQYGPGTSRVAEVRRNQMNPNVKLQKMRSVTDEDLVLIMGHHAPGAAYGSAHPPLAEQGEPDCPIRKLVAPTEGAKAGDRVRYIQFADSMLNAPCQPYQRSYLEMYRYRGIDPGTLSGRQIIECRERDLEQYARELIESELFDPATVGIRGATVHGHSLRLAENGMMFDAVQRCILDDDGIVKYVKDQVGNPLDRKVAVGKPMDAAWLKENTPMFHSLVGTALRDDAEYVAYVQRIHALRTKYGFMPKED
ncbi:MAG TPA: coenzyme-B sulfoethylthiotransferase subunit gamma [Methanocorpusculum sp.]|nr:coenzyme-B sulfoethylthiotransferase subunit gamma [Methanocorpusculum sp.]MBR4285637.1 coenzyme-B sulfoethylthiotransferase subunit gamma [Methanocorpusculum sp.]MBR5008695.1 coenzyme-B sulfoethylthiotransferase subunit gamma [Methanocorpusculum sp.]MBR5450436.1 coenzyme-B sulfoethylthiotransferase subunit gamma [Methanocorpusculum sp.]MEE1135269.1 coenzyme-B sulfoethylthiotransferase subunit gamma [Methanocorpusculum sp.]